MSDRPEPRESTELNGAPGCWSCFTNWTKSAWRKSCAVCKKPFTRPTSVPPSPTSSDIEIIEPAAGVVENVDLSAGKSESGAVSDSALNRCPKSRADVSVDDADAPNASCTNSDRDDLAADTQSAPETYDSQVSIRGSTVANTADQSAIDQESAHVNSPKSQASDAEAPPALANEESPPVCNSPSSACKSKSSISSVCSNESSKAECVVASKSSLVDEGVDANLDSDTLKEGDLDAQVSEFDSTIDNASPLQKTEEEPSEHAATSHDEAQDDKASAPSGSVAASVVTEDSVKEQENMPCLDPVSDADTENAAASPKSNTESDGHEANRGDRGAVDDGTTTMSDERQVDEPGHSDGDAEPDVPKSPTEVDEGDMNAPSRVSQESENEESGVASYDTVMDKTENEKSKDAEDATKAFVAKPLGESDTNQASSDEPGVRADSDAESTHGADAQSPATTAASLESADSPIDQARGNDSVRAPESTAASLTPSVNDNGAENLEGAPADERQTADRTGAPATDSVLDTDSAEEDVREATDEKDVPRAAPSP